LKQPEDQLHRGLEERHINLMALGATIGVGLFLGSATAIRTAGPAILLTYLLGGLAIFLMADRIARLPIRVPFYPLGSFVALGFLALVVVLMAFTPDTRVALVIGPVWIVLLGIAYAVFYANRAGAPASTKS